MNAVQLGIGKHFGLFCQYLAAVVASIITSLIIGWQLALVTISFLPILAFCGSVAFKVTPCIVFSSSYDMNKTLVQK